MMRERPRALASWETFLAILTLGVLAYAALAVPNFTSAFNISQAIAGVSEKALIVAADGAADHRARDRPVGRQHPGADAASCSASLIQAGVPLAGWPSPLALLAGAAGGAFNGVAGHPARPAVAGRDARHARDVPRHRLHHPGLRLGQRSSPTRFTDFGIDNVSATPVPWTIVPFLVLAPIFAVVLQQTPIGRRIYAIGGNPDAALYAGRPQSAASRFRLFVVSGLVCAARRHRLHRPPRQCPGQQCARLRARRHHHRAARRHQRVRRAGKLTGVFWALVLVATLRNVLGPAADRRRRAGHGHRPAADRLAAAEQHREQLLDRVAHAPSAGSAHSGGSRPGDPPRPTSSTPTQPTGETKP